ncbi:hypothetical protein [Rhodococcus sp. NPDC058514]|uniref:hypothetical protein n=1 Tax=unclassified Rhodococcus (in: high G+C Gram-positive bacteria) TaxID=192944 RepID=UPI00366099E0
MPIAAGEPESQTPQGLQLSAPVVAPGESLTAVGEGCPPGTAVAMSVGGASAGTVVADGAGGFEAPLSVGPTAVGRYQVAANCGPVLTAPLDVVLVSQAGGSTSTAVIVVFFLAMGLLIYRRRLLPVSN